MKFLLAFFLILSSLPFMKILALEGGYIRPKLFEYILLGLIFISWVSAIYTFLKKPSRLLKWLMVLIIAANAGLFTFSLYVVSSSFNKYYFPKEHSYKPEAGYVSNEITAMKMAEAVLASVYGEDTISKEKPFNAELKNGIWIVTGTLHCPDGNACHGGVAVIEINNDDGRILRVSHGK